MTFSLVYKYRTNIIPVGNAFGSSFNENAPKVVGVGVVVGVASPP